MSTHPDAMGFAFLGKTVYVWGLWVALGCLAGGVLLLALARRDEAHKNAAALTCLLSPLLGLVGARLLYVLLEVQFRPFLSLQNALNLELGGFSMYGALLGAVVGAVLAARWSGLKALRWLDYAAPALLAFIALARLGEGATALGISRPLVTGVLDRTFLAFQDEYDAYLRTYLLESLGALVLCGLALRRLKRPHRQGGVFLFVVLCYGITQNLFESLRYDGHLRFSFIGVQQVLSVVLFSLVLIALAVPLLRQPGAKGLAVFSLIALLPLLGAMLWLEFMIDRSEMSKWISYGLYAAVLAVPLTLGVRMLKRSGYNG